MKHVAIKVQRRKYATDGLNEIAVHQRIDRSQAGAEFIIGMKECFMHDGHVCQVFEFHGQTASKAAPMPFDDVKRLARQVLEALQAMHRTGLVHTDIKPENLLWCAATREVRVIDLGCAEARLTTGEAIATREYSPPEMLIGNPMAAPVDLWSLGCTLFELLTGELLFNPWSVCEQKYAEFDEAEDATSPNVLDGQAETFEQLGANTLVQDKYRLITPLGSGKFGTVWQAAALHERPLHSVMPDRDEAHAMSQLARTPKPTTNGYNLYEIALNYEQFVLMQECLGAFPDHLARSGAFHHILYDSEGNLRFQPDLNPRPIAARLVAGSRLTQPECCETAAFLESLLRLDPSQRVTADEALRLGWC